MGGSGKGVSLVEDNDGGGVLLKVEDGRRRRGNRETGKKSDWEKSDWRERESCVRVSETIRR